MADDTPKGSTGEEETESIEAIIKKEEGAETKSVTGSKEVAGGSPISRDPMMLIAAACFVFLIGVGVGILLLGPSTTPITHVVANTTSTDVSTPTTTLPTVSGTTKLLILNDKRCVECDVTQLTAQLSSMIDGLEIEVLDYSTGAGKRLYSSLELKYLPAVLFNDNIENTKAYSSLSRYLEVKGDYRSLRVGAGFDPTAEICDNKIDDTGNDLVDCDDPTCSEKMICREDIPLKLDVFVMSQCPYGTMALDAMEEILPALPEMDFSVHYIANNLGDGKFNSLHGQPEVDLNILELCAMKHYPEDYEYMNLIWCVDKKNVRNFKDTWETCASDNDMDASVIKACAEGDEGKQLLSESILISDGLGISASPTWVTNNRYKFGGIDAEGIKNSFCKYNEGLAGCNETLTGDSGGPSGSC